MSFPATVTFPEAVAVEKPGPPSPVQAGAVSGLSPAWRDRRRTLRLVSQLREYLEVLGVIAIVTIGAWVSPLTHHALGHVYLLAVILLCLRVGRGPVLLAAISSALAWNYFFIPPRFSFQLLDYDDGILLGIYFAVAIIAGQLTARIRAQERQQRRQREQATALYQLTRALAGGRGLDEALGAALPLAEGLFGAPVALLLAGEDGRLTAHPAGAQPRDAAGRTVAEKIPAVTSEASGGPAMGVTLDGRYCLPLRRGEAMLGVLVIGPTAGRPESGGQRVLRDTFAAQIALLLEREQLRAAAEREKLLAESDRLHRTLFDSVSHELKTPLAVLRAAGEKLDTPDTAKRAGLAGEIRTATTRLDRLVANLLDQTRLESGALRVQLDWCDLRDLVQAARRAVGDALAGHAWEMEFPADLPLVLADAPLMEHAITNLLLNAAHHTPAGCPVTVTAGTGLRGDRRWVFVRVADRGPGLPAELHGRLFQKFYRGQSARPGGLGLGLSIVRGFLLAQGGEVVVASPPGGGASFTLYLPHVPHGAVPDDES